MPYRPRYRITQATLAAAEQLSAARAVADLLPLPLAQVRRLRRETLIRVAHNSTWIENRALALAEAVAAIESKHAHDATRSSAENEVRNYFDALELMDDNLHVVPNEDWMRRLHAVIMRGAGVGRPQKRSEYRTFTVQVGNVYIAPAAEDVPTLMAELGEWATSTIDTIPDYLFAAILAYQFVTIHPFADGNGRMCRALATWALRRHFDTKGLLNVEEFYVRDLDGYYDSLQMGLPMLYYASNEKGSRSDPDLTEWIDYFCRQLAQAARQMRADIEQSFRARHPDLLDDPLMELPDNFRRFLAGLDPLDQEFGAGAVQERFGVSDKSARDWIKRWREAGYIEPMNPGGMRVRRFRVAPEWLERFSIAEAGSTR